MKGRHLRTIPHTGTRALMAHRKAQGAPYLSVEHLYMDKRAGLPVQWGAPVDVTVRHPMGMLISAFHHVALSRLRWYQQLYEWRDLPNVQLIQIETSGVEPGETATPDYFGLRRRYFEDGEPYPADVLAMIPQSTREWLRAEYYPDV